MSINDKEARKKYIGESSDQLAAMVTMISRLPIIVTVYMSKNRINRTFCISGFCVSPRRTNSVTLFPFSMCSSEAVDQVSEAANEGVSNEFEKITCFVQNMGCLTWECLLNRISQRVSLWNMILCNILPHTAFILSNPCFNSTDETSVF